MPSQGESGDSNRLWSISVPFQVLGSAIEGKLSTDRVFADISSLLFLEWVLMSTFSPGTDGVN